jgi:hypothetical protein
VRVWTDATQLVIEDEGQRWSVPLGGGAPWLVSDDLVGVRPVEVDSSLVRFVARDLVRVSDIAHRAGVTVDAVTRWRRDHRGTFPAPVIEGSSPLFYWPDVVAAGFGGRRRPGRPRRDRSS